MTEFREIRLTKGQVSLVDEGDFERINSQRWRAAFAPTTGTYYAVRTEIVDGIKTTVFMHRRILGIERGDRCEVDHRDNKRTLDNRRSNLRVVDRSRNQQNKRRQKNNASGFKGVYFDPMRPNSTVPWRATITVNGKQKHLGRFASPEIAHDAYKKAAQVHYGEFARFS